MEKFGKMVLITFIRFLGIVFTLWALGQLGVNWPLYAQNPWFVLLMLIILGETVPMATHPSKQLPKELRLNDEDS